MTPLNAGEDGLELFLPRSTGKIRQVEEKRKRSWGDGFQFIRTNLRELKFLANCIMREGRGLSGTVPYI